MKEETLLIRSQLERSRYGEHSSALHLTSSFLFEDAEDMRAQFAEEKEGMIYSRYANPNVQEFIDRMVLLEEAESGWATSSGMAAIYTLFTSLLDSGDHVVASRLLFGSTYKLLTEIFTRWNIRCTFVDDTDVKAFEQVLEEDTKLVFVETPSNPGLEIIDLIELAHICRKRAILLAVDNCFATPYGQKPLRLGADISLHSATKYLDGQGRVMGGVILSSHAVISKIKAFARHSGPSLSPFNAWILSKSLETLHLRFERHSSSALYLAQQLEGNSALNWVKHPFLVSHPQYEIAKKQMFEGGGIITLELAGGIEAGKNFLNALELFSLTANLGDAKSIATHPASTTHSKLQPEERMAIGITDGLVRLSIGLEHPEDLLADVLRALS